MAKYKISFSFEGKSGKISMKLKNAISAENASTLLNHSIAILESNLEEEPDEEEEELEEEEEEIDDEEKPDISKFERKSIAEQFPNASQIRLRVIYYNTERKDEMVKLLSDKLHISETECDEMISLKTTTPPMDIDTADELMEILTNMGAGVSPKPISDDATLFGGER